MKNFTIKKLFRFVYTVPLSILLAGCTYVETESLDNELSQVLPSCNKRLHEYFAQNNMPKFIRGKVSILEKKDLPVPIEGIQLDKNNTHPKQKR